MSSLVAKAKGIWKLPLSTAVFFAHTLGAKAQVYGGSGVGNGIDRYNLSHKSLREIITSILQAVLSYVALAAVTTIIFAGVYLIVGLGSDDSKERAKKIIQYTLIGLLVILFSEVIVGLVTNYLASKV